MSEQNVTTTDTDGVSLKALGNSLKKDVSKFGSGIKSKIVSDYSKADDNIIIPVGSKTLLGDNFESLYESTSTREYPASDGSTLVGIEGNCSYETEMRSGMCSLVNQTSYDLLADNEKAMYEITLLSKKYASEYGEAAMTNDSVAQDYTDKMSQYRAYCEANNIDWGLVCNGVNIELQTECAAYLSAGDKLFSNPSATNADSSRIVTNRAHGLVLQCVPDGYEDSLCAGAYVNYPNISYEDTLDTAPHYSNFLIRVKDCFVEKWNKISKYLPHPIKFMKSAFFSVTDELGSLTDASVDTALENRQEAIEAVDEMKTKTDEFIDGVKDKTQQQIDAIDSYIAEQGISSESDVNMDNVEQNMP